jgi:hypothetical protein
MVIVLALLATFGAYGPVAAAQTSTAKVVIIVGATHSETAKYRGYADQIYAEAIQYTPNVVKVYSPNATINAVRNATLGANIVVYLGHGNGFPSPYGSNPNGYVTKDGFGLNADTNGDGKLSDNENKYYGEPYIYGAGGSYGAGLRFAPNAVVLLFHLCYASGNSEPGQTAPTLSQAKARVDNYGSAFLKEGASAVIADGHNHSGYIAKLFTSGGTLGSLWNSKTRNSHADIVFAPTRSTGTAILDPDDASSSFYRSIVGNVSVTTAAVTGKLPTGSITASREDTATFTMLAARPAPFGVPTQRAGAQIISRR